MRIVEADITQAQIITDEVPGEPLLDLLIRRDSRNSRGSFVRAFYLAGRWLRIFQRLVLDTRLIVHAPGNPLDLVEFCDLRLTSLRESGYHWPSPTARDRMLKWLRQRVEATPEEMKRIVWCHEDYGPYNVMWDGRVLTPIDFDTCRSDLALVDVANMNHWLDMLPIQFPWRRWPIERWKRAYLRGYGLSEAERVPIYSALTARCLLARLKKSIEYPGTTKLRRAHNLWCRHFIHAKLERLTS